MFCGIICGFEVGTHFSPELISDYPSDPSKPPIPSLPHPHIHALLSVDTQIRAVKFTPWLSTQALRNSYEMIYFTIFNVKTLEKYQNSGNLNT